MIASNDSTTRAHLVIINSAKGSIESDSEEFFSLVLSAGAAINDITYVDSRRFYRRSLIGAGKIQEITKKVATKCSDLVVFNHSLTPSQERNLEQAISCRVIDRTRLILDIFAQRAVTKTGKLQVELAQLNHLSTRLIRGIYFFCSSGVNPLKFLMQFCPAICCCLGIYLLSNRGIGTW